MSRSTTLFLHDDVSFVFNVYLFIHMERLGNQGSLGGIDALLDCSIYLPSSKVFYLGSCMVLWSLFLEGGMSEDLAHKNIVECITGNILRTISTQAVYESLTLKLKTDVVTFIKVLIDAFKSIGAKEAEVFLFLCEKKIPPLANQPAA